MNMIRRDGYSMRIKVTIFLSLLVVFFFPTSINGRIIDDIWIVRNGIGVIMTFYLVRAYGITIQNFTWCFLLMFILSIFTIIPLLFSADKPNDLYISVASASGEIITFILWAILYRENRVSKKCALRIVNMLSIIILIWGWGLVFAIQPIVRITQSLYSQLNDDMFSNMVLIRGKPVMSFGTHSMSAFFTMLVFYFNALAVKEGNNSVYRYIIMVLLMALEVPMTSNTAIVCLGVMAYLFVWSTRKWWVGFIVIVGIIAVGIYLYATGVMTAYVDGITNGVSSELHGFSARYFSGRFDGNFEMVSRFGGVGFLRSRSEFYKMNDSAIIYLFTQGNAVAVVLAYSLMYRFFKNNYSKYWKISLGLFFIWEIIASSTFISVKMVCAHILTMYIVNSLTYATEKEEVSKWKFASCYRAHPFAALEE